MKLTEEQYRASLNDYKIVDDGVWIPRSEIERLFEKFDQYRTKADGLTEYKSGEEHGRLSVWRLLMKLFP